MKNKIAAFCTGIMLLFVPSVLAEEITPLDYESVVFYNSANEEIKEIGNNTSVTAKVNLDSAKTGYVLAAQYNENGRMLSGINVEKFTDTADVAAFDMTVDTTNADTVKVFAFEGLTSPEPILSTPGILKTNTVFEKVFPNIDTYLYRVGNGYGNIDSNSITIDKLFKVIDGETVQKSKDEYIFNVTVKTIGDGDVIGKFTKNTSDWSQSTLSFNDGTGVVGITITDYQSTPVTLYLEVVDAYNVTTYSELGNRNSVFLNDITMDSGKSYYLSGATLYGNGFTFDVSKGSYEGSEKGQISDNYLIYLTGSTLDNVKLVGAVYTEYGAQAKDDYNNPVVLSVGNNTITNSYIANCAAPVRVKDGNIEIVNTTLKGGNFANLDIRGGHVTLDNVTTINQVNGNDTAENGTVVVGLGVVVYYENVNSDTTVEIKNGITQYNHLSKSQANTYITDTTANKLVSKMFDTDYSDLQYNDGSDIWINTGILSMTSEVGDDNISDVDGYSEDSPTMTGVTGYIHTKVPNLKSITATVPKYVTARQNSIAPEYSFDYTTKNYLAKTEGSNDYCYEENGTVFLSFDDGDTFNWDTEILTVDGITDYTVSMNGTDYTKKSIAFTEDGNYNVAYTYIDNGNYTFSDGRVGTYPKTYTKYVYISVSAVKPNAKNAEFTFGSSNTASTKVTIGNNTYVMPDVSATSSTIGSTTVNGTTVYYPIREIVMSDGKTSHSSAWYAYFPVFDGAVTITDYADGGLGDAFTYGSSTTTMPSGLSVVGEPKTLFKYQSSSEAGSTPVVKNNILVYSSPSISKKREEYSTVIQYSYQDNAGATFYYYIGYHAPAQSYSSTCVTPDTLVTLADGSQKRIDAVSYDDKLLVWNFYTGKYDTAPVSVIINHGYDDNEIIELDFDDGTSINFVGCHGAFNINLNEFVDIDASNVSTFIGDTFFKRNGNSFKAAKLIDYNIRNEYNGSYSILSHYHYNVILNGMLTISPSALAQNLYEPFEVGDNMKFDAEKMQSDIEKYGLNTYEEFADHVTYDQYIALNMQYINILVGKGYATYDDIIEMIYIYVLPFVK